MNSYSNFLTVRQRGKSIAYGGDGVVREDGDANYGFKYLKGNREGIRMVPELVRDQDLCRLAEAINSPETDLFSVGCVSGNVTDERGFRDSGYIEFCFNSRSLSADAGSYFPVFFHFDRYLHELKFNIAVRYQWELESAAFLEADHYGFTVAVFINTHYCETKAEAAANWSGALEVLGRYLQGVTTEQADYLYPQ